MNFRLGGVVLASLLLVACASSRDTSQQERSDPLEGFNRSMFSFNYYLLDPYLVRPAAVVWRDYVPHPARNGLTNFFDNLAEPAAMVNYFAEGKPYEAMIHFNRFFLNTIVGMGGLIDVATMQKTLIDKARSVESDPCVIDSTFADVEGGVKMDIDFTFACQAETLIFQLGLR